jgi:glycine/D-amino acid oxidase-like deaminating enzyme
VEQGATFDSAYHFRPEFSPWRIAHNRYFTPVIDVSLPPPALTIDTPRYLPYLSNLFQSMGGRIVQQQIQHISQLQPPIVPQPPVSVIIVCAGIGARYLGGVEDKDVYPIRGQTVLVRAPHITFGRTLSSKNGTWTCELPGFCGTRLN